MKILRIVGVLMMLMGAVWFLPGINILPGSFMTGQIRWAVYGGITVFVGTGLGYQTAPLRRFVGQSLAGICSVQFITSTVSSRDLSVPITSRKRVQDEPVRYR